MTPSRSRTLAMLAAVAFATALSTPAWAAVTPTWSNATTDNSTSDFDTGTLLFPGILGRTLTIQNPLDGYYHDHDNGCSSTIEVHMNGNWLLVRTGPVSNDIDLPLASIGTVSFQAGIVDGVRLGSTCLVSQAYHSVNDQMTFLISDAGNAIPTLSEIALAALAALMLGVGGLALRRRQGR